MESRSQELDDRGTFPSSPGEQPVTLVFLVMIAAVVTYAGSLGHGYVWDDHLIRSQLGRAATEGGVLKVLGAPYLPTADIPNNYYRPVVYASYWLDRAIGGDVPAVAHLTSILLHALAAVLVFLFARRVLDDLDGALAAALVFAVHPVHVESVAWVAGRADILCAVCSIGAALAWGRACTLPETRRRWSWLALCGCLFGLACLSKEQALALPLLLLAFPASAGTARPDVGRSWSGWLRSWAVAFLPAAVFVLLLRQAVLQDELGHVDLLTQMRGTLLVQDPVTAIGAFLRLLRSLIVPWPHDALITRADVGIDAVTLSSVAGLAALAGAAFRWHPGATVLALSWTAAFAIPSLLVPSSGVVVAAERYAYVPSVGVSILLGAVAASRRPLRAVRPAWRVAAVAVLTICLGAASFMRATVWASDASLTADIEITSPESPLAHVMRAEALANQGRLREAIRSYRLAVTLNPGSAPTLRSLGLLLLQAGDPSGAADAFRRAVDAEPDWTRPRIDLGVACAAAGDWACVEAQRAALRASPTEIMRLDQLLAAMRR